MIYRREITKMRIFLDANVLFSLADARSRTSETLSMLMQFNHEVVTNSYAWGEAYRNLESKRPHWLSGLEELRDMVMLVDTAGILLNIECEEKDKPILAGAIGTGCTHLWTGDKAHFGKYYGRKIHGVMIVSNILLNELLLDD